MPNSNLSNFFLSYLQSPTPAKLTALNPEDIGVKRIVPSYQLEDIRVEHLINRRIFDITSAFHITVKKARSASKAGRPAGSVITSKIGKCLLQVVKQAPVVPSHRRQPADGMFQRFGACFRSFGPSLLLTSNNASDVMLPGRDRVKGPLTNTDTFNTDTYIPLLELAFFFPLTKAP